MEEKTINQVEELGNNVLNIFGDQIVSVEQGMSSIYHRDDVVRLLNTIMNNVHEVVTSTTISNASTTNTLSTDDVIERIKNNMDDLIKEAVRMIDFDATVNLDLNGREIEVSFDERDIASAIIDEVSNGIDDVFDELKKEQEA